MSRRIRVKSDGVGLEAAAPLDSYFDKVLKYIPADIVGGWIALMGLISAADPEGNSVLPWIVFAAMVGLTGLWTWRQTTEPGKPVAVTQIVIATFAFVVWVFALGGPFETLGFWQPLYGSILLILYTLAVGLVDPPG